MSERVLTPDVFTGVLEHSGLPEADVMLGAPTTGVLDLGTVGAAEVGIWEMSPGVARDTETDEIFIVLSGAGRVQFADGTSIELVPGVAVRLYAGERTVWTITESLRKVFVSVT